jgi:glycosidase
MEDWKALVTAAHGKGFKVIVDWVANHTGADHAWLTSHPNFYEKDSTGKAKSVYDWTDTRSLDFNNQQMRDSMIAAMKFWIKQTDIDGFRCDVAGEVPDDFWRACIAVLRRQKEVFMLAEGEKPSLHKAGFDASYPWEMFQTMKRVAKGEEPASSLDKVRVKQNSTFPVNAIHMYFTSNHDENSWNKADYETMPGAVHAPFAVLTQTMQGSVPLIYSGQEEPVLRKIEFFEKDPMNFAKYERARFYRTLLNLRKSNPALAANASFQQIPVGDENSVYAYVRARDGRKVFVILNLSAKEQSIKVNDPNLHGNTFNVFKDAKESLTNKEWKMEPWGYVVYEYK